MIEGALEADGRIAAKNATKIRAALLEMADYKKIFLQYQETQPISTKNKAQDNSRARSWAIMNVRLRTEALASTLWRTWAEAYVLGEAAADEWIKKTIQANKAADDGYINWKNWQPGDRATALMLRRPGAFQKLLDQTNATIKGMDRASLTDIGNALATTVELGLDAERASILIGKHVASSSRALTIAITEQNRAMSAATIQRYKDAELEKMEWQVSDPCNKCAQNSGVVVSIGTSFPSGNTQPPAHPHCRCVLLPIIPGMEEPPMTGATLVDVPPVSPPAVSAFPTPKEQIEQAVAQLHAPKNSYQLIDEQDFKPGAWTVLTAEQRRESAITQAQNLRPGWGRTDIMSLFEPYRISRADKALLEKGTVYKNGKVEVQFYFGGSKVPEADRKAVIDIVEKLQMTNPKDRVFLHIEKESKTKYGWAYGGMSDVWITPKVAMSSEIGVSEGTFKMPIRKDVTQREYTLAHEWGHLIDKIEDGVQNWQTTAAINEAKKQFPNAFKSGYSAKNSKEFYAEMFAEYWNSKGQTTNELVQYMATRFGWKAPEVPKVVVQYKPATKPFSYFTAEKSQDLYPLNAKGEPDYGAYNRGGQNLYLKEVMREQGFLGKPQVVSAKQYDDYVNQGAIPLYRGIAGKTPEDVNDYAKQLLEGDDPFVGKGMFGDGIYFANKKSVGEKFAKEDAQGNPIPFGKVLDGVLDPRAKIIDIDDLRKELSDWYDSFPGGVSASDYAQDFYEILSAPAVARGYDAIRVKNPSVNLDPNSKVDADYLIVLNRTALILKEIK